MNSNEQQNQSDPHQSSAINSDTERCQEEATPESEQLLNTIFEQAAVGIGLVKVTGQWLQVNQKLCGILGYTREELLQKTYQDVTHPDEAEAEAECIQQLLGGKQTLVREKRYIRKDGTPVWTNLTVTLVREAIGEPKYIVGVIEDITERKQAQEALSRAIQEQESIMKVILDVVYVLDQNGNLVKWNQKLETITGLSPEVIKGRSALTFFPEAEQATIASAIKQVFETGKAEVEGHLIGKDQVLFPYEWNGVTLKDEAGNVIGMTGIGRDITERKRTEELLRQQAQREQLLAAMRSRINASLNLEEVLNTTAIEVRQFLQTDRVIIYRFAPNYQTGTVVVESQSFGLPSMLGRTIINCDIETDLNSFQQNHILAVEDINTALWTQNQGNLLSQFQVRAKLAVPILQAEKLWGLLIAHHCSGTRQWQQFEIDLLASLATQVAIAIGQAQLYEQKQYQVQREQAINRVTQAIRASLDLDTIFTTAIDEIGKFLQVDRAELVKYLPERKLWLNVVDYRASSDLPVGLGVEIPDQGNEIAARLKQLEIVRIDDTNTLAAGFNQEHAQTFPGAWLLVPLHFRSSVWGSLTLVIDSRPHRWQDSEVELACAVADQLAMALQQSELYQQVQQLNTNLERQVQKRTAQLQQAFNLEAMLKRITDKVRDSLDESQILQTAVQELALGLEEVKCCDAAVYNAEQTTSTIEYEYACSMPSSQGRVLQMADFPDIYPQLLQSQFFQYCPITPDLIRGDVAILTCPIFDDQGVLGDLCLFKQKQQTFDDLEIRLVQQIANQCAIAMRQARLYQAVQAQVEELAKLNRLKDDFLSTVSHELRTPVTNMKMAIQMLTVAFGQNGTLAQQEKAYKYLQILQDECAREINLINNLLDLQHLESGEQTSKPEIIHLQTWLPQALKPFQAQIHNSGQTLQIEISPTLPPLVCDSYILRNVLAELLNNACKYTPSGEQIIVTAQTNSELIQIKVINFGSEIPMNEIPRIFDKFYRVPSADPWKQSGTGLGLALAQKMTEHLGGNIQVVSQSNQTCFTVELPIKAISD